MSQLVAYCQDLDIIEDTILCGDMNMNFNQIWPLEKYFTPHVDFPTWFANRVSVKKTTRTAKFDRIYTGARLQFIVESMVVVGHLKIPGLEVYPSDHIGIVFSVCKGN